MKNELAFSLQPIRVLLVEDSPLQLYVIKSFLDREPGIKVVGTAVNGQEALVSLQKLKPDVVCTDYHMPVMNGLEFIEKALQIYPCPILVLSISVQPDQIDNIFNMLSAGAIDVMPKPIATHGVIGEAEGHKLIEKIRILNGVHFIKNRKLIKPSLQDPKCDKATRNATPKLIALGASTGGPQALEVILPYLDKNFPVPIVCIQHMSHGFMSGMLNWLRGLCSLEIEIAISGNRPLPGHMYFAPDDRHLTIDPLGMFQYVIPKPEDIYQPGVDQLFKSVAEVYGAHAVGVILSGMGKDGAEGLQAIFDANGQTIAQDENSSVIFGMPGAAIELGVVFYVLPVDQIGPFLNTLTHSLV
jgi:two-component system chemotaxis response regulator CheB